MRAWKVISVWLREAERCSCVTFNVVNRGLCQQWRRETSVSFRLTLFCSFQCSLILSGRCCVFYVSANGLQLKGNKLWNLVYNRLSFIRIAAVENDSPAGIESTAMELNRSLKALYWHRWIHGHPFTSTWRLFIVRKVLYCRKGFLRLLKCEKWFF